MTIARRAALSIGGLAGVGLVVDYKPSIGLTMTSPIVRAFTGMSVSCDEVEGPIHAGEVTFGNLRVRRPSPSGKEQTVTDIDLTVQRCVLKFQPGRLAAKEFASVEASGIRGDVRLAPDSPPFDDDGASFGAISVSDVETLVSKRHGDQESRPIAVRVEDMHVENVKVSRRLPIDMFLKCTVRGSAGEEGKEGKFSATHDEAANHHEWHCQGMPFEEVHPLAVQSSVLPLDWLTGSFDLHVACAADISARPVNAQLQCSAQLHRVQAVVPPGMEGIQAMASASVVGFVNAHSNSDYKLQYAVNLNEEKLIDQAGGAAGPVALVVNALSDALVTNAAGSWMQSAREWVVPLLRVVGIGGARS